MFEGTVDRGRTRTGTTTVVRQVSWVRDLGGRAPPDTTASVVGAMTSSRFARPPNPQPNMHEKVGWVRGPTEVSIVSPYAS
jgi:hypothetical protein